MGNGLAPRVRAHADPPPGRHYRRTILHGVAQPSHLPDSRLTRVYSAANHFSSASTCAQTAVETTCAARPHGSDATQMMKNLTTTRGTCRKKDGKPLIPNVQ